MYGPGTAPSRHPGAWYGFCRWRRQALRPAGVASTHDTAEEHEDPMRPTHDLRSSFRTPLALAIALLGTALLAQPALGQDDADSREMRRIVQLRSGQTLRAVTRFTEGHWAYRGKEGWRDLEPNFVVATALESEVLHTWREKKGATLPSDLDLRIQIADWALSSGLVQEGLDEMSAVLAFAPDSPAALDSLRRH